MGEPQPFIWVRPRHAKLEKALKDQIKAGFPLARICEVTIGSHPNSSRSSISIGDEASTNCLNGNQRRKLDSGGEVEVLGYNEDGKPQKLKLKRNRDGHAALEGQWGSIMQKNGWSRETRICFWGFPYGDRNCGEPRFVLTDDI